MTEFLLVRHGETAWNTEGRIQGYLGDSPLTEAGHAQALAVAERLARERIDRLFASDTGRTRQTTQPIEQLTGLAAVFDSGLRERNYGLFEGRTFEEVAREFPADYQSFRTRDPHYVAPGGESAIQFRDRAVAALTRLAEGLPGARVAVVTHGGVLGMMYRHAMQVPLEAKRSYSLLNASINRFRYVGGRWELIAWGDIAHLDGAARDEL